MVHRRLAVLALLAGVLVLAGACGGRDERTPASWRTPGPAGGAGGGEVLDPSPAPQAFEAAGAAPSSGSAEGVLKTTGSAGVALTFDDGPSPEYTPQILGLLRKYGVKATFCLIGVNVRSHPELVQAIVRDGHTLCNHTWSHDLNLGRRPPEEIRSDLQRTSDEIHAAVPGVPIRYFRHPGGNFTPAAVKIAREMGMVSIGWAVDPRDWETGRQGPAMTGHIVTTVERYATAGAIVLSHDGGGDRHWTVEAYQTLLPWLTQRFKLVAMPV
jgi:peptidoglycan-N-acetylglucosamine deacetylase